MVKQLSSSGTVSDIKTATELIRDVMQENSRPILVSIDGRSGAGKSTISKEIVNSLGGVVITSDDFWVGGSDKVWDKRTPKQRAEMAIDWKRIRNEVLMPLIAGKSAKWHPFDWAKGKGLSQETHKSEPVKLIVLDGAYSSKPELQDIIDLSVLVEMKDDKKRRERLIKREGVEYMNDWHSRWDPAEDYYFSKVRPRSSFDIIINN